MGCQGVVMVTNARLPVLWLCGAPATGKSTVAWQVFSDLADRGLCAGYLDIDQIGMLQPPPDADPRGHRFAVDNLAGMVRNYRAAGAQVLVVSGVIEPERGPDFAEAAVGPTSPSATSPWMSGRCGRVWLRGDGLPRQPMTP